MRDELCGQAHDLMAHSFSALTAAVRIIWMVFNLINYPFNEQNAREITFSIRKCSSCNGEKYDNRKHMLNEEAHESDSTAIKHSKFI
jgi:hypothetical protein